ncbi:MAG: hypothetical protein IKA82_02980 [Clostridia bacterium]|nr:hypothetical protein [Clostridia bacterium]
MLKALPIKSKEEQELICNRCGVEFDADYLAYSVTVDGLLVGICQFKFSSDGGIVRDIGIVQGSDDYEALFVLGRAVLNIIDLCGTHYAYYTGDVEEKGEKFKRLITMIGFLKNADNGRYEVDLNGFFDHPCQHH